MTGTLPLAGVRVADFSWVIAGPRCTEWLAAMGAEVIKVESHYRPDRTRGSAPFLNGVQSMDGSAAFNMLNYSKKGCTVNLGSAEGREVAHRLIAASDIVIENFSRDAAAKMGLEYRQLATENPALVMISCSGLGRTGPDADAKAFGKSIHAFAGHTYLTGWPGTPPRGIGTNWTDPLMGAIAALAAVTGVMHARATGEGVFFDLSMAESTIALMAEAFLVTLNGGEEPAPRGNASDSATVRDIFTCRDGEGIAVAAHDEREVAALFTLLGDALLTSDAPRKQVEAVANWCAGRSRDDALSALWEAEVCAAPLRGLSEIVDDAHYIRRDAMVTLHRADLGVDFVAPRLPWVQHPQEDFVYTPAPTLGQDNRYVFQELLGLTEAEIAELTDVSAIL